MATPFPVAVMAGPVNPLDQSPAKACSRDSSSVESPILIFLLFHKAVRAELDGLQSAAAALAIGRGSAADVKPLFDRYRFLRAIYKYHCNAEDEVDLFGPFQVP